MSSPCTSTTTHPPATPLHGPSPADRANRPAAGRRRRRRPSPPAARRPHQRVHISAGRIGRMTFSAPAASRTVRRARPSCRVAAGVRSSIGAISSNGAPNMSCRTNASRSGGVRVSSTTSIARPTESVSSVWASGCAAGSSRTIGSGSRGSERGAGRLSTSGRVRRLCGSSTVRAPSPPWGRRGPDDHGDQRTSRSPGLRQQAPLEHRNVHMRPTKDLVDRMCAGQRPARGAPPGTRTPNPRIKSPNLVVSRQVAGCRPKSILRATANVPCRRMPSDVGSFHGHRALIEHRDSAPVLDALTGARERSAVHSSGLVIRWSRPLRRSGGPQLARLAAYQSVRLWHPLPSAGPSRRGAGRRSRHDSWLLSS